MRLAAIDCGTNTIRLLIGDYELTDQGHYHQRAGALR